MLMIPRYEGSNMTRTLKLEGKLPEPRVCDLQTACELPRVSLQHVFLDLRTLTHVDAAGIRPLESLIAQGAKVIGCS